MSTTGDPATTTPSDPEEIRRDIEQTRQELGDTVEALAAKTDVKAQAQARVEEVKATVHEKKDEILGKAREISPDSALAGASTASTKARENPLPVATAGAFLLGLLIGRWRGRRAACAD